MIYIKQSLAQAVKILYPDYRGPITLDSKKDRTNFEYSTAVAFHLAKEQGTDPKEIAQHLKSALQERFGSKISIFIADEAPAFINFVFQDEYWLELLQQLPHDSSFQWAITHNNQQGKRVLLEFISANPTGPLTLANGRGGYSGDALARVFDFIGAKVEREYYVNDIGNQILELGKSIVAARNHVEIESGYKGDYIQELATHITSDDPAEAGEAGAAYILETWIKPAIQRMGITFNRFFSEKELVKSGALEETIRLLEQHNLLYEAQGAYWLKSTELGDDKDRVIRRTDGTYTYLLTDITYHRDKIGRNFDLVMTMVGADHFTEAKTLDMVVQKVIAPIVAWQGMFKQPILQLVRLIENGQEVKMSKRAGTFVTLDDLLTMVPSDVARFFFIWHSYHTHMDFDLTLAKQTSDQNPVYYIQYAYVRSKHILENIADPDYNATELERVELGKEERQLLLHILEFSNCLEMIASTLEIHYLAHYAIELARLFHIFYTVCPVIKAESKEKQSQRIALTQLTFVTLKQVLSLIGVTQPEKMVSG